VESKMVEEKYVLRVKGFTYDSDGFEQFWMNLDFETDFEKLKKFSVALNSLPRYTLSGRGEYLEIEDFNNLREKYSVSGYPYLTGGVFLNGIKTLYIKHEEFEI
jgi:hypothetical protein